MKYLRVRNWDKWQTYRKDRGRPPWIKVHRRLSLDPDWASLSDAERGQLVCMWILAADRDGAIPSDPAMLKKLCCMEKEPDMQVFVEHGFIEGDVNVTSTRRQRDVTDAEAEKISVPSEPRAVDVRDLWRVWLEELGGKPPHPRLTATRSKKLKALADEHLEDTDDPIGTFRSVLRAVKSSDHHMSKRDYQFPESLFRNEDKRDRWMHKALSSANGRANEVEGWTRL